MTIPNRRERGIVAAMVFAASLSVATPGRAQLLHFEWIEQGGSTGADFGNDAAVDPAGNIFVTGFFRESTRFGDTTLSGISAGIFLVRLDPEGKVSWARSAGGSGLDGARSVATDAQGNAYIAGAFQGEGTFGTIQLTALGGQAAFVAKYDATGSVVWVTQAGGGAGAADVAVGPGGVLFVTGEFSGSAQFGTTNLTSSGQTDIFLAKLDAGGQFVWVRHAGGGTNEFGGSSYVEGVGTDAAGNGYVTGILEGTNHFGNTTLVDSKGGDIFLAKYDSAGALQWARQAGASNAADVVYDLAVDAAGHSHLTGWAAANAQFGATTLTTIRRDSQFYLARYDSAGQLQWVRGEGDCDGYPTGAGVALDAAGHIYVTGTGGAMADGPSDEPAPPDSAIMFLSRYNSAGQHEGRRFATATYEIYPASLAVGSAGSGVVAGSFYGKAQFGRHSRDTGGPPPGFFTSATDVFVAAFELGPSPLPGDNDFPVAPTGVGESTLDRWTYSNPLPTGSGLSGVTWGNGNYVAIGEFGAVATSPDGQNWTQRASGTRHHLRAAAHTGTGFVAVGDRGTLLGSPTGDNWIWRRTPTRRDLRGVAAAGGRIVAVGNSGLALVSSDAVDWARIETGICENLGAVTFGLSRFIAAGDSARILSSPDGGAWTQIVSNVPLNVAYEGAAFSDGDFILIGGNAAVLSDDGVDWPYLGFSVSQFEQLRGVTGFGREYLAVGRSGDAPAVFTSRFTGILWDRNVVDTSSGRLNGVVRGPAHYVAVGSDGLIMTSPDGITWTNRRAGPTSRLNDVVFGNDRFVAVGDGGTLLTSATGAAWSAANSGVADSIASVAFGNGKFVALRASDVLVSADAVSWNRHPTGAEVALQAVAYGDGQFVAVGNGGATVVSPDGVQWTRGTSGVTSALFSVVHGNGLFVAGGSDGVTVVSANGRDWTASNIGAGGAVFDLAFGDETFVAVGGQSVGFGSAGQILTSTDGLHWTVQHVEPGHLLTGGAFGEGTFAVTGARGPLDTGEAPVLSSRDGISWTRHHSGVGDSLQAVSAGNGRFVMVGDGGTIVHATAPPRPPALTVRHLGPGFALSFTLQPGRQFRVESSSDLINWTSLGTSIATEALVEFIDSGASLSPIRFYRVALP